jgi:hypothetical protein
MLTFPIMGVPRTWPAAAMAAYQAATPGARLPDFVRVVPDRPRSAPANAVRVAPSRNVAPPVVNRSRTLTRAEAVAVRARLARMHAAQAADRARRAVDDAALLARVAAATAALR